MNIYTKGGDKGITSLIHTKNVSKSDDRIQLVGSIDELTSHLGLVKTLLREQKSSAGAGSRTADGAAEQTKRTLELFEEIQQTLITVMSGVADPYNKDYKIGDEKTGTLEAEIDRLEALFERPKRFILPGQNRLSAEIDIARTVARRAERALASVSVKFGSDNGTKKYMNRLADYLYVLARYEDAKESGDTRVGTEKKQGSENRTSQTQFSGEPAAYAGQHMSRDKAAGQPGSYRGKTDDTGRTGMGDTGMDESGDQKISEVVQEVIRRVSASDKITLEQAKRLIEEIEKEAQRRGKKAVIAVCTPDGNPIAVHVMDGAFLVSFDVAVKKAYTSVAVKMSTMELNALAQPGGTFYGLDKMEGGNIIIFGGGVPIKVGDAIIGGLGVSGGTGEEDHSLAMYGLSKLAEIL